MTASGVLNNNGRRTVDSVPTDEGVFSRLRAVLASVYPIERERFLRFAFNFTKMTSAVWEDIF